MHNSTNQIIYKRFQPMTRQECKLRGMPFTDRHHFTEQLYVPELSRPSWLFYAVRYMLTEVPNLVPRNVSLLTHQGLRNMATMLLTEHYLNIYDTSQNEAARIELWDACAAIILRDLQARMHQASHSGQDEGWISACIWAHPQACT